MYMTRRGAAEFNRARLALDFPEAAERLHIDGVAGDFRCNAGSMIFLPGMRIRLTENLDKDRGFLNGALGIVAETLSDTVFTLHTTQRVKILVHPIWCRGKVLMPCTYAWATTMRRAQGTSLDLVGLVFDRCCPDRGYAYVGASRARHAHDLFHVGRIRRSDWLPVTKSDNQQLARSAASDSDSSEDDAYSDELDVDCETTNSEEDAYNALAANESSDSNATDCYMDAAESSPWELPDETSSADL